MAKQLNGIWKVIFVAATALITIGALCATIRSNESRIEKVEALAAQNVKDIVELKTDVKYIRSGVDEIKKEVKK